MKNNFKYRSQFSDEKYGERKKKHYKVSKNIAATCTLEENVLVVHFIFTPD